MNRLVIVLLVVAFIIGAALGYTVGHPRAVVERALPAVVQPDSSVVLARMPDAHATPNVSVPRGQTVDRIERVEVQGPTMLVHDTLRIQLAGRETTFVKVDTVRPPPVHVELVLTRLADGTHRVIAKAIDGTLLAGVDVPVADAVVPRVLSWGAGFAKSATGNGGYVTRDVGPFQVLGAVTTGARGTVWMAGAGFRF